MFRYLPRKKVTDLIGWVSNLGNERFQRRLIDWFIRKYNVNTEEMLYPVGHYKKLYHFFIRELKPSARPIDSKTIVAPVDGIMTECGSITDKRFECKGELLSARDLIAFDEFFGDTENWYFTVHYLSPRDYHWIHSPVDGEIYRMERMRGDLYPVFNEMIHKKKDILCINERYNVFIRNDKLRICVSMVAAMGVGNIIASDKILKHNETDGPVDLNIDPIKISKGEKLAYFALGSTVVLIFSNYEPDRRLKGEYLKLGTGITGI